MRVLGIAGSVRRDSHNRRLLKAAARALPPGTELVAWDGLAALPAFDEDLEAGPEPVAVVDLRAALASADALLIATPEYNAAVPGLLKNAIDWASRPFDASPLRGLPVAVIGASTGLFGAVWAQAEARRVLAHVGARVLDRELPVGHADGAFADDGTLRDAEQQRALAGLLADLVGSARATLSEAA